VLWKPTTLLLSYVSHGCREIALQGSAQAAQTMCCTAPLTFTLTCVNGSGQ
jgi:hypothetical protein